jgi:hypothetical protein
VSFFLRPSRDCPSPSPVVDATSMIPRDKRPREETIAPIWLAPARAA